VASKAEDRITAALRSGAAALDLTYLGLETLPETLGDLANLTSLNLSGNRLKALPGWLSNLTNLTELDLGDNRLNTLPEWLGDLTNLTVLALSHNPFSALPEWLGDLTNLTDLNLYGCQLKTLPDILGDLTNLTTLNLHGNQLTVLPRELENLTDLTKLYLRNNQLAAVPDTLGNLTNLTVLALSDNQFSALPRWLGDLTNLTEFELFRNQLTGLPDTLGNLTNLTSLGLSENQLTVLPDTLGGLTNLTSLYLADNAFAVLPGWLGNLSNLTYLTLHGNQLTVLPDTLGGLTNLTYLTLHGNQLTVLPDTLGDLTNLTSRDLTNLISRELSENNLVAVPDWMDDAEHREDTAVDDGEIYYLDTPHELGNLDERLQGLVSARMLDVLSGFPASVSSLAEATVIPSLSAWLRSAARSRGSIAVYDSTNYFPAKAFFEFDFGVTMSTRGRRPWKVLVDFETGRPEHCPPSLAEVYQMLGGIQIQYGASGTLISPREAKPISLTLPDAEELFYFDADTVDPDEWWPWFECDGDYLCYHPSGESRWFGSEWGAPTNPMSTDRCVEDLFWVLLANKSFNGAQQIDRHRS
jgi:Leucine-rich repeat (LRR) protein